MQSKLINFELENEMLCLNVSICHRFQERLLCKNVNQSLLHIFFIFPVVYAAKCFSLRSLR